ncbi:MAG: ribose-5-phosphate isomerase RpiA [Thermoplasmatota archaeon]
MEEQKRIASHAAVEHVKDGMRVGLGTGSTVKYAIERLGERVQDGLDIVGVATSKETEERARRAGIPLEELDEQPIDVTIDGADQVDPALQLIKGGGGALLREKMVADRSRQVVIVVDESKLVEAFTFPLPVEVTLYGWKSVAARLKEQGLQPDLRPDFVTDNGNVILDCSYDALTDLHGLAARLNGIPGVVEHGLFLDTATAVIVGTPEGAKTIIRNEGMAHTP